MSHHPSFELIRKQGLDSIRVEAREYRHIKTGARHLHLAADDSNNVFTVGFLTVPQDSTGVAHILEHTSLCGSKRYPVRDPFFMMIRRSLNTFMNAFTSSDWTAYPFATQNRKDYDNLLQVYLDAVFFPRLDPLDFAQEGHRVEFETADDSSTELVYKGVVFNEMKGAMSSPHRRLWQALSTALFPTTTYHHNSGGEPAQIPKLTYQQLKAFHARHYHPSNAFITTYGDFPEAEHQAKIHELALQHFDAQPADFAVPDEQRFSKPKSVTVPYAYDSGADEEDTQGHKTHIVIGWLWGNITDLRALMHMHLLAAVLLDNSASPLQLALETTDLGQSPSVLGGMDGSTREAIFVCGLEGSEPQNADAVEALILDVIEGVANEGVAQEAVDAVLHQLELEQREVPGRYPFGLALMETAMPVALHGGDPIAALDIDPILEALRQDCADPDFIKGLARRWLLENPHRIRMTMVPDNGLSETQKEAERSRLAELKASLGAEEQAKVVELAAALSARQQAEDDPNILPKVQLSDVPSDLKIPEGLAIESSAVPLTCFDAATNGLVYEHVLLPLPDLSADELALLNLYCSYLTEVGVGDLDYLAAARRQSAVSGGIGASVFLRGGVDDVKDVHAYIHLHCHGLARNQTKITALLLDTFQKARFDETGRLRELIAQHRAHREASVTGQGHSLAVTAACAGMGSVAAIGHQWYGLAGLQRLIALDKAANNEGELKQWAQGLAALHEKIRHAAHELMVIGEDKRRLEYLANIGKIWQGIANGSNGRAHFNGAANTSVQQGWAINTQVNFCAKAYPTVAAGHPDAAALMVLGRFLHNGFLHTAVREQGGAYGSSAAYDGNIGAFTFSSYRDPRLNETLADFDQSLVWLKQNDHDAARLEEAILGVASAIDRPGSPASEAATAFVAGRVGRTPAFRRQQRQRVLDVKLDDLLVVAERHLRPELASAAVVSDAVTLKEHGQLGLDVQTLE